MGFGLFGKVPQKRDFLSVNLPNQVLHPFETWLQSAVTASRAEIGRTWEQFYLVAPIWRFWIGPSVIAPGVAGALMPSVDQVGRYFPLAILHWAEPGAPILPPLVAPMDGWYGTIDQRLLAALSEETDSYLGSILHGLEPPPPEALPAAPEPEPPPVEEGSEAALPGVTMISPRPAPPPPAPIFANDLRGSAGFALPPNQLLADSLGELRDLDYRHATAGRSYWWCGASPGGPAQVIASSGLPDPYVFSRMLLWPGKG